MKVIVVGAGSFGSWSAIKLLQAGCEVTLIDAWGPGHSRSSSGGETRVIRTVYGHDEVYVEMAKRSMAEWQQLEGAERPLIEMTGSLWLCGPDDSYVRSSMEKMRELDLPLEEIAIAKAKQRWPQINFSGLEKVFFEPMSGFLRARLACQTIVQQFVAGGGTFVIDSVSRTDVSQPVNAIQLASGESMSADAIVFAGGPWLKNLFPSLLGDQLQISRQEVYYFGTPAGCRDFSKSAFPIWLELNEPIYYGIPSVDHRGFKVALDERGPDFDPTYGERTSSPQLVQQAREYLCKRFPLMEDAPLIESRVCQYSNTADGHFIVDQHDPSGLLIAGGGSGHGFKMGPAIGQMVVDRLLHHKIQPQFSLSRLKSDQVKSTQFDHS